MSEAAKKRYADPIKGEAIRRKISETLRKRFEDPIKGEESRRKLSEAGKLRVPASEETRRKHSVAMKKRYADPIKGEELRRKHSVAMKGENNPHYGKKMSNEQRLKIRETLKKLFEDPIKGEEYRKKMSEAWNQRAPVSEETRRKHTIANQKRYADPIKGQEACEKQKETLRKRFEDPIIGEETRRKMSESHVGQKRSEETKQKMSESQRGENHPNWHGGISYLPYCPKFNNEFKERVRAFFDYRCVECGTQQKEKKLGIHHVNFDKQSCCNDTIPLFVPLCSSCHSKTNNNREYWKQYFTEMINNYYSGKCYYTKEEMTTIRQKSILLKK